MPVRPHDDMDKPPRKPLIDADKVAQVIVFLLGVAVFVLIFAYR